MGRVFYFFGISVLYLMLNQALSAEEFSSWRSKKNAQSLFHFLRANGDAHWAYFQPEAEHLLKPFFEFEGWVLGDPHIQNFSVIQVNGQNFYIPYDFDDSGQAPFILDFLRLLTTSQSRGLDHQSMVSAYIEGLEGVLREPPRQLQSVLKTSLSDYERHQRKFLSKFINKNRFKHGEFDLQPVARQQRDALMPYIVGEPLDFAVYKKPDGGSQGVLRYWVLVEKDGELHFLEFKKMVRPSVAQFRDQVSDQERLSAVLQNYWPESLQVHWQAVEIDKEVFLRRWRQVDLLKVHRVFKNPASSQKMAEWSAYMLGDSHKKQNPEYAKTVIEEEPQFRLGLGTYTEHFLRESKDVFRTPLNSQIQISGDVRYRYQWRKEGLKPSRNQHKLRARLNIDAVLSKQLSGHVQLTTGEEAASSHENLGDGFINKEIFLSRAYIDYHPLDRLNVWLGKMPKPFYLPGDSQLIWDSTVHPEGVALMVQDIKPQGEVFWNASAFMLQENFRNKKMENPPDQTVAVGQLGGHFYWQDWIMTVGGGPTIFNSLAGTQFADMGDKSGLGNTDGGKKTYLYDYHLAETFLEIKRSFLGVNTGLYGHYVKNWAAPEGNEAYLYGLFLSPYSWRLGYAYTKVEPDAVVGAFNYSNPADGGTDYRGQIVSIEYRPTKELRLRTTAFFMKQGLTAPEDFDKIRFDITLKF